MIDIIFIVALIKPTVMTRKIVFWAWVVLMLGIVHIYEAYIAFSGEWVDFECSDEVSLSESETACRESAKILTYAGAIGGWAIDAYFGYVIWTWSKNIVSDQTQLKEPLI